MRATALGLNRAEFGGRLLDRWDYLNKVELDFSRSGKPTDNAYIEAFNSRLRQECLNAFWFVSMGDAQARTEEWRCDYDRNRPHSALGGLTPVEFAGQLNKLEKSRERWTRNRDSSNCGTIYPSWWTTPRARLEAKSTF